MNDQYRIYRIKQGKKSRQIEEPNEELKKTQAKLIPQLETFQLHPSCMAIRGKGISDNARIHEHANYVLKVDIKSCYKSVTREHVIQSLEKYGRQDLIPLISCCFIELNGRYILPTGAPTSPILCNIALTPIDYEVEKIIRDYQYTRYMDDLHLSTTSEKRDWNLINQLFNILKQYGFRANKEKSKWATRNKQDSIIITGVRIGAQDKVPRNFNRTLRAKLENLARNNKELDPETRGCLAYIKSIDESKYVQFLEYFEKRKAHARFTGISTDSK